MFQKAANRPRLCPRCRKLVGATDDRCPWCGLKSPGRRFRLAPTTWRALSPQLFVRTVIGANVVMFVLSLILSPQMPRLTMNPLNLLAPNTNILLLLGASGTIPIDRLGRWWSLLSANYLHGGLLHILFNMLAFRILSEFVLREFGVPRTIVIYTLGGIAGFAASYAAGVPLTIGASAAICAMIGASLYYGLSRGGVYGHAVFRQVGGWAVAIFIFGALFSGVDNWAHAGGMASGVLLGYLVGYTEKRQETARHRYLANLCVWTTIAVLFWAAGSGVYYRFFY